MKIPEILNITEHRPWELRTDKWKYYQEWNNVIFLHWQVNLKDLLNLVPPDLAIDMFEGKPWVSLVAFTMEKIRPRYLPAFSPVSDFNEINIRTYVKYNNKSGVYFLSIEGGTAIACKIAKTLSELPYRYSNIKRGDASYFAENSIFKDSLELNFKVGPLISESSHLEKWLTERYALFQDTETSINEFDIHHTKWPISKIEFDKINVNYPRFDKLLNSTPDLKHYSTGVKVLAWDKKSIKKGIKIPEER